jgi:hypothetical protein
LLAIWKRVASVVSWGLPLHFSIAAPRILAMSAVKEPQISVAEAAAIIGCTEGRVRQLIDEKKLVGRKLHQLAWIIERESAEAYAGREITVGRPRVSA